MELGIKLNQLQPEHDDADELGEGSWRELFLLHPDVPQLRQVLESVDADDLLHAQVRMFAKSADYQGTNMR